MFEDCRQFFSRMSEINMRLAHSSVWTKMGLNSQPGKVQHFYYPPEKTIFPVGLGEFFNDSEIAGVQNTACVTRETRVATVFFFAQKEKKKNRLVFYLKQDSK